MKNVDVRPQVRIYPDLIVKSVLIGIILLVLCNTRVVSGVYAQEGQGAGPVYVIQEGDSLWDIALRFGVSLDDLQQANNIVDPGQLTLGSSLVIPGLEGIQGVLSTRTVGYGETLLSLSRRYQAPLEILVRLNHLTSPAELYAGATLVVPEQSEASGASGRVRIPAGQSLLELAVLEGINPWSLVGANNLPGTWGAMGGDVLRVPGRSTNVSTVEQPGALPEVIHEVQLKSLPFVQGKTAVIQVSAPAGIQLGGSLIDHELKFFPLGDGRYMALQGIHAMTEPGLYPLTLSGTLSSGEEFSFSQAVYIRSGDYLRDPPLTVSPETIDPAVTKPEDAQWAALSAPTTPEKFWEGVFESPAPPPFSDCWPSLFGSRRSYNGSAYNYFHAGLDFCGGVGTQILSPAAGRVVFAGPLTVRGNATMIDHGWGIYTGYMHQSEIFVKAGEMVEAGQAIGLVGGTGRVTGPHLHWEVFAGSVQVDPLDWLEQEYP